MNDSLVRGLVAAQVPVGGAGAEAGGGTDHVIECLLQERWRSGGRGPCRRPESLPAHAAMEAGDLWPALRLTLPWLAAATEAGLTAQVGHVGASPAGERRARPSQTVGNTPAVLKHKQSITFPPHNQSGEGSLPVRTPWSPSFLGSSLFSKGPLVIKSREKDTKKVSFKVWTLNPSSPLLWQRLKIMNLPLSQRAYQRYWERIVAVLKQVGGTPPSVCTWMTSEGRNFNILTESLTKA